MGLIDDELSVEEKNQINQHLIRCTACREEYESLSSSGALLGTVSFVEQTDEVLNQLWKNPFNRLVRNSGLVLLIGGYLGLLLLAMVGVWRNKDGDVLPAILISGIIIGFFLLLYQMILERVKTYKNDPYKDIQR